MSVCLSLLYILEAPGTHVFLRGGAKAEDVCAFHVELITQGWLNFAIRWDSGWLAKVKVQCVFWLRFR